MNREHVIVDGYNLLHAHPVYASMAAEDLDGARARLVADLAGFAQGGPRTIVVFDGGANPASDGAPHHIGALTVIFSPAGTSADSVIESLAQRFRDRAVPLTVITSDGATRDTVRSGAVAVTSSQTFASELAAELSQARTQVSGRSRRRVPVAERIDADVAATLARWSRGK